MHKLQNENNTLFEQVSQLKKKSPEKREEIKSNDNAAEIKKENALLKQQLAEKEKLLN